MTVHDIKQMLEAQAVTTDNALLAINTLQAELARVNKELEEIRKLNETKINKD